MYDGRYGDGRYDRSDDGAYDYAKVVDVQPLTTRVRVSTPQRECWDETRYDEGGYQPARMDRTVAGSTLLGAAIGAVIGNQIGHGQGRDGGHRGGRHHRRRHRTPAGHAPLWCRARPPQPYTVQRCETRYHDEYQERIDGYRVTYVYHGRRAGHRAAVSPR